MTEFNDEWNSQDMITFIKFAIEEMEVSCQWEMGNGALCNHRVKAKDMRAHLHHRHGVTSESQMYPCLWHGCSSAPMRRSSLERHVKERHVPAKWACPDCTLTFTRESTMMDHIGKNHG